MFGDTVPNQLCTQNTLNTKSLMENKSRSYMHSHSKKTTQCHNKPAHSLMLQQLKPWTFKRVRVEVYCGGAQIHDVQPRQRQAVKVGIIHDAALTGVLQQGMQVDGSKNSSKSIFLVRCIEHAF